jgi:protein-S-isoprenylcysteine O-methyltransferase Ste14
MPDTHTQLIILSWLVYFGLHSLLASIRVKQYVASRWPRAMPAYRLMFNLLAVVLLAVPLWLTLNAPGPWLWRWSGVAFFIVNVLALAAVAGFLWSLKFYDTGEFLGLRQLREGNDSVDDQEQFRLSPLHRWVRHPWYFFALVIIWTRDMNSAMLITAIIMTLYFIIGSRLEEEKLIRYHGEVYRRYRERVPGLVPLPWKHLREADEQALIGDRDE